MSGRSDITDCGAEYVALLPGVGSTCRCAGWAATACDAIAAAAGAIRAPASRKSSVTVWTGAVLTTAIRNWEPFWTVSWVPRLGESRKTTDCPAAMRLVVPLPLSTRNVTVMVCGVLFAAGEEMGTDAV